MFLASCRLTVSWSHARHDKILAKPKVKGLGRPKEFMDREEGCQLCSMNVGVFFAGVIRESEIMSEWSDDEVIDMTMEAVDLEVRAPTCAQPGAVLQQAHTASMALTGYEATDTVAISRKNPLVRDDYNCGPTTRGRKRNLLRTITSPGRMLSTQSEPPGSTEPA